MIVLSTLKILCDLLFYLTFANTLGVVFGGSPVLIALPFFAAGILLSTLISNRGALKFAPMALLAGAFLVVPFHLANIIVLIPACVYTIYALPKPSDNVNEFDYAWNFRMFLYIFIPFFILFYLLKQRYALQTAAIPNGLAFMAGAILLLRLMRHDVAVLKEKRFMTYNVLSVVGVLALSIALGSQTIYGFLKAIVSFVYFKVLAPLLIYIIIGISYVIQFIINLFTSGEAQTFKEVKSKFELSMNFDFMQDFENPGEGRGAEIFKYVMYSLGALLLIAIIILIFRALSRRNIAESQPDGVVEIRRDLNVPSKPQRKSRRNASDRVREIYRKILILCCDKGIEIKPHFTSGDVERASTVLFGKKKEAHDIRDIYIKVRYAEKQPSQDEVKSAKNIYDILKKESQEKSV